MSWLDKITPEELLALYDRGTITRVELVSALAEGPPHELSDQSLAEDVAFLREKIAAGETFVVKSIC